MSFFNEDTPPGRHIVGTLVEVTVIPWILPSTGELKHSSDGYPRYLRAFLIEKDDGVRIWVYSPVPHQGRYARQACWN